MTKSTWCGTNTLKNISIFLVFPFPSSFQQGEHTSKSVNGQSKKNKKPHTFMDFIDMAKSLKL